MSSTGTKTSSIRAASTIIGENSRLENQYREGNESGTGALQQAYATVISFDPKTPRVKVNSDTHGTISKDEYIPLNHDPQEIIERWGQLHNGMRVLVTYTLGGETANATIVGVAGQKPYGLEPLQINEVQLGMFAIFPPGIGLS